mgnify:CR=1 FL=1
MQRAKSPTIPKFGNWDKKEDLSYSIVFDAARADKEKFMFMSQEDEHDRALFHTMKKGLQDTSNQLNLKPKTRDLIDNNLSIPNQHPRRILNEVPKEKDGNGDRRHDLKENRPENRAQAVYESHLRKVQGNSIEPTVQGKPNVKKVYT